jgi:predicted nucleotide-binding protein
LSHGHNELLKLKLKDFLQTKLKQTPVILAEQPNRGLTIVEKLERASEECWFAIILMTKDDEQQGGGVRARQNVVHEIGFFQGKYGRKNVILLAERGVEVFSNISGIVRIEFDANHFGEAFEGVRKEIEAALPSAVTG